MGRLLLFGFFVYLGYLLLGEVEMSGSSPRTDGRYLVVETDDLEFRFHRMGSFSESYMLFGGNKLGRNSLAHAFLAGLPVTEARLIAQRYPDFHMCKSPGAKRAQRATKSMSVVGAGASVRRKLNKVVNLHEKRLRSGGERTCVSLSGAPLELDSVSLKADGSDVTRQVGSLYRRSSFFYAEQVEIADCQPLLR
jgi:hypothetical protein